MSVRLRRYRSGGWEVDITTRLPNGSRRRERCKAPVSSKTAALRWGEDRERHLLQHGVPQPRKEVPTLEEFAPRFLDGYARANRQKASGVAAKEMIVRVHLTPALGARRLDAILNEDVQRLKHRLLKKAPKTVNNILTVLNVLLKKAVEWDVIERLPCTIKLLPVAKAFDAVLRLRRVRAARRGGQGNGPPGIPPRADVRGSRTEARRDGGAGVDRHRLREASGVRAAFRVEGADRIAEGRPASLRAAHRQARRGASRPPTPSGHVSSSTRTTGRRSPRGRFKGWCGGPPDGRACSTTARTCCATRSARTWRCWERRRGRFRNWRGTRT